MAREPDTGEPDWRAHGVAPPVRFIVQKLANGSVVANVIVSVALPGYGKTERAAMRSAAAHLRDFLDEAVRAAMKRSERAPPA